MVRDLTRGLVRENPIFVTMLGLCPSLAITTHLVNALGLGLGLMIVLIATTLTVSVLRSAIPVVWRTPVYLAVTAVFVTAVDVLARAYLPALRDRLGIFVPLLAVNCIIVGRAHAFARRVTPARAALDALGMGIGFTVALSLIALIREVLGLGTITLFPLGSFSGVVRVPGLSDAPVRVVGLAAGALLVVGYLKALFTWIELRRAGPATEDERGLREEEL